MKKTILLVTEPYFLQFSVACLLGKINHTSIITHTKIEVINSRQINKPIILLSSFDKVKRGYTSPDMMISLVTPTQIKGYGDILYKSNNIPGNKNEIS